MPYDDTPDRDAEAEKPQTEDPWGLDSPFPTEQPPGRKPAGPAVPPPPAVDRPVDPVAFVSPPQPLDPFAPAAPVTGTAAGQHVIVKPRRPLRDTAARVGEELVAWFKTLVSAAVYATLIVTFGFQVARVEGHSMAPTLEDQDRLIVNKLEYRLPNHDPMLGDIVMLLYPKDPEKSFVKRIVGAPGDTVKSINGQLFRNDEPLPDDFIPEEYRYYDTWGPEIVPEGYYFVMGDHRNNSSDSRTWGFVPKKYIIGKVQLRWWPITEMRMFSAWE